MNKKAKRKMDALTARALLFQRKLAELPVPFSIPGVPELDNLLSVIELGEDQLQECAKLATDANGVVNNALSGALAICKSLVLKETKERLCTDLDAQFFLTQGHSVLAPLNALVVQVSALNDNALENAKKNFPLTVVSGSDSSLPENSAAVAL